MSSGKFLRSLRENKGFSLRQVSIKSGVSHTQIADIEKGVNYGTKEKLDKILMALGASGKEIEKFYDMQDYEKTPESIKKKLEQKSKFEEVNTNQVQMIELPVYGRAAAGNGYINMENIIRTEYLVAIPGEDFPKGAFIAEVYGESMFPTLLDGDFAIVDPDCNDKNINNQICVVTYNGQTFIKRVVRKEKYVVLMSDNPDRVKYEDIIVPTDEYSDLVCHGIVIECRRKFKRR
ncbi:XRE family transcriptional regulator [Cetobacterium sp.]|uniref:XRE family transcriptional regulator n=1 Tax=Cetobacterium sp. TaxID=2071632 RepID=UPI003EE60CE6